MKLSIEVLSQSSKEWLSCVLNNFNEFLQDHADCERKASSMALSFLAKYPDRLAIVPELIETALEELEHFQQVYRIMEKRGIQLSKEIQPDPYINQLLAICRTGKEERFLDRMLLASVVECRGAERFRLIYENIEDPELKKFYHLLWASEAKHGNIFVKLSLNYFEEKKVYNRLKFMMEKEAEILASLKIRAALH